MTAPTPSLLDSALTVLRSLGPDDTGRCADRALDPLRAGHPRTRMRVLRHREAVDESVGYGMLITEPDGGTISLSWTPAATVPWSLRGAQRTAESMLLRVNGQPLAIEEAMAYLDVMWEHTALLDRLIAVCLVRQELAENPVRPTATELQHAMDAFRRARGLLTVAATEEWMRERALGHEALEELVAQEAAIAELKRRILAERGADPAVLDRVRVTRVRFTEHGDAEAFATTVRTRADASGAEAAGGFAAAVAEAYAGSTTVSGAEFVEVTAADLAHAAPGTVIGPVEDEHGWQVTQVLAALPAVPGQATDRMLADAAFDAWIAERRQDARIEWFWGAADKTPTAGTVVPR